MVTTTLDPKFDTIIVHDSSQNDFGKATVSQVVASAITPGSGVTLSIDQVTGKTVISSLATPPPSTPVSVLAGTGLSGGGVLSANVTLNLDIAGLPAFTAHDQVNDSVAVFDVSAGITVRASIQSLHAGLYLSLAGGVVAGDVTANNFKTAGLVGLGSFTALTIPPAAANLGAIAYASDRSQLVYSDGVNWRRMNKTKIYV